MSEKARNTSETPNKRPIFEAEIPGVPPSLWRCYAVNRHGGIFLTKTGRSWKREAMFALLQAQHEKPLKGRIAVRVRFEAHSRGRWDIDNRFKVLFDAMTEAGVWSDDSQVDRLESEVVVVPLKVASKTVVAVSEIEEGK
ncbi:RusA family crossover junction endodeoxyribonuclease [Acetomicrobium sp.]|jgi:crossover junction endodeoxyribonuclease RusA|uniref:RusA family crossover junction endodeoxyribonuclease n=1 Tax=Acetomicrobium sp. TaxID=1872099 RepID=UPI002FC5B0D9